LVYWRTSKKVSISFAIMPVSRPHSGSSRASRLKWTAVAVCVVLAIVGALLGLRSPMLHQYEYQEDLYLSLDGTASLFVSASLPALVALYGMDLPIDPASLVDRAKIRQAFGGPGVTVSAIRTWRRWGRRFVTVRLDTTDVRRLPAAPPFAAAAVEFGPFRSGYRLVERLGPPANRPIDPVGWDGGELVGFRWHIPSKIASHNTGEENFLRGNILVWEQPLTQRLAGVPLVMEVQMQPQSILYSALWLFAMSVVSAVAVVALLVWWVVGRGRPGRVVRT
jgi:hypothetical protein